MANHFIGSLNVKYDKRYKGFLLTSYDNVCCMWTKGWRVEISHFGNGVEEGLFMAKQIDVQRKLSENCSIGLLNTALTLPVFSKRSRTVFSALSYLLLPPTYFS